MTCTLWIIHLFKFGLYIEMNRSQSFSFISIFSKELEGFYRRSSRMNFVCYFLVETIEFGMLKDTIVNWINGAEIVLNMFYVLAPTNYLIRTVFDFEKELRGCNYQFVYKHLFIVLIWFQKFRFWIKVIFWAPMKLRAELDSSVFDYIVSQIWKPRQFCNHTQRLLWLWYCCENGHNKNR